jgi:amino acid permease
VASLFLDSIVHLATMGASQSRAKSVFDLVCYSFFILVWPLMTVGRLLELRLSLLWILPILVSLSVLVISLRENWGWVPLGAFIVALAVQVPLVWLSPPKELAAAENTGGDRSYP